MNKIMSVYNKNNCFDLFQDIKVDNKFLYMPMLPKERIRMKYKQEEILSQYKKMKLIIDLRAVKKVTFLRCVLKRIKLAKELFLIDMEQGDECFIPTELS